MVKTDTAELLNSRTRNPYLHVNENMGRFTEKVVDLVDAMSDRVANNQHVSHCFSNPQNESPSTSTVFDPLQKSCLFKNRRRTYRNSRMLCCRQSEYFKTRMEHPDKIPVIVERMMTEKYLPEMKNFRFIVSPEVTIGQLIVMIKGRLHLPNMAVYAIVSDQVFPALNTQIGELAERYRDPEDCFLYVKYASEDIYG
ncbi:hypothetical protein QR680_003963 [Steinernema hermaphroditum]|uniref:Autophagy-related protein n=1 Tax=Steinernema hermaphroditum TaxID=289476 RepID=A0AA39HM73_9BILA|nr:hypothetical protein QR680_003963 [Steinernema hermaphroditum]